MNQFDNVIALLDKHDGKVLVTANNRILLVVDMTGYGSESSASPLSHSPPSLLTPSDTTEERLEEEKILRARAVPESYPQGCPQADRIGIPLRNNTKFYPTDKDMAYWKLAYPNLDIPATLHVIASWNQSNPTKRKTLGGVKKHIDKWLKTESQRVAEARSKAKTAGRVTPELSRLSDG